MYFFTLFKIWITNISSGRNYPFINYRLSLNFKQRKFYKYIFLINCIYIVFTKLVELSQFKDLNFFFFLPRRTKLDKEINVGNLARFSDTVVLFNSTRFPPGFATAFPAFDIVENSNIHCFGVSFGSIRVRFHVLSGLTLQLRLFIICTFIFFLYIYNFFAQMDDIKFVYIWKGKNVRNPTNYYYYFLI